MTPWVTAKQWFSILPGTLRRNDYELLLFHLLKKERETWKSDCNRVIWCIWRTMATKKHRWFFFRAQRQHCWQMISVMSCRRFCPLVRLLSPFLQCCGFHRVSFSSFSYFSYFLLPWLSVDASGHLTTMWSNFWHPGHCALRWKHFSGEWLVLPHLKHSRKIPSTLLTSWEEPWNIEASFLR